MIRLKFGFKTRRRLYNLTRRFRKKANLNELEVKIIDILNSLISRKDVDMNYAPISITRYIWTADKSYFMIISPDKVIISNHTFGYNISLSEEAYKILSRKFDRISESHRRIVERTIVKNMVESLDKMVLTISQQK
jgi:hypothetical protein